jgi:hypothetical protein
MSFERYKSDIEKSVRTASRVIGHSSQADPTGTGAAVRRDLHRADDGDFGLDGYARRRR